MSEPTHIIDIESIVLEGVDHLRPMEMRVLIAREVQRALLRTELSPVINTAVSEGKVANAVAHSVNRAITVR